MKSRGRGRGRGRGMGGQGLPAMVAAIALLGAAGCGRLDGKTAQVVEQEIPVRVISLTADTMAPVIEGSGVLAVREEIPLAFKVGGVVARVLVDEGQQVRAGQLLATLERQEVAAAVAKAKSALYKA